MSGEDLASYAANPPSDRTDPVAVAAYVATAWTSGSSSTPWIDERGGWVTPEFASAARALSGEAAVRADLTTRSQVVNLDTFTQAGQITVAVTLDQLLVRADHIEPRLVVVVATMIEDIEGWRVAWLERS